MRDAGVGEEEADLLYEVLHGHLVNALGGEDDVGSSRQNLFDSFLKEHKGMIGGIDDV